MSGKKPFSCKLARMWNRFLAAMLPRRGKRAIFLTTLYVHVCKLSGPHRKLLEELNQNLGIVSEKEALNLPVKMHNTVWWGRELNFRDDHDSPNGPSSEELDFIAERAMRCIPEWSHYGDQILVRAEAKEALRQGFLASRARPM